MNGRLLIPGIEMISVAAVFVLYWKTKTMLPWVFFLWGGVTLVVSGTMKIGAALTFNKIVLYL